MRLCFLNSLPRAPVACHSFYQGFATVFSLKVSSLGIRSLLGWCKIERISLWWGPPSCLREGGDPQALETPQGSRESHVYVCAQTPAQSHKASLQSSSSSRVRNRGSLLGLQAFHQLDLPGDLLDCPRGCSSQEPQPRGRAGRQDPCTRCPALTGPAFKKGENPSCGFFPLPLFSPSWATLSSLVASCAISAPERARSPAVPPAPLRPEGCTPEGWAASGRGDAWWWERC